MILMTVITGLFRWIRHIIDFLRNKISINKVSYDILVLNLFLLHIVFKTINGSLPFFVVQYLCDIKIDFSLQT